MASRFRKVSRRSSGWGSRWRRPRWRRPGRRWGSRGGGMRLPRPTRLEWVVVRRDDLDTSLVAGGDLEATKQTTVACQVEDLADSDGTMILEMIDNGAVVKKGDVALPAGFLAIRRDGPSARDPDQPGAGIVPSGPVGARDRPDRVARVSGGIGHPVDPGVRRPDRPGPIGYATAGGPARLGRGMVGQGISFRRPTLDRAQTLARFRHELRKAEGEFQVFRRYEVPKEIQGYEVEIETAENNYRVEADRLKVEEDTSPIIRKQIAHCIHPSPARRRRRPREQEPMVGAPAPAGDTVYQDEEMFMLPDLTQMEVPSRSTSRWALRSGSG